MKYTAFGEIRLDSGTNPTDYHEPKQSFGFKVKAVPAFTHTQEQRYEVEFGLSYYVARLYDPQISHFIQADSLIPQPGNALDWDRYAYVLWNPMKYTDPSGHAICDEDGNCFLKWNEQATTRSTRLPNITLHYLPIMKTIDQSFMLESVKLYLMENRSCIVNMSCIKMSVAKTNLSDLMFTVMI